MKINKTTMISLVCDQERYRNCVLKSTKDYKSKIEYVPLFNVDHATKALNEAVDKANHNLIVICHQDFVFVDNIVKCMETWLPKLDNWGVCGLAGATRKGEQTARDLPGAIVHEVLTVDSMCVILDKRNSLRFDEEFLWWHMYAEDLCLQAIYDYDYNVYVLPCGWIHPGDDTYDKLPGAGGMEPSWERMREKWYPRVHGQICTTVGEV